MSCSLRDPTHIPTSQWGTVFCVWRNPEHSLWLVCMPTRTSTFRLTPLSLSFHSCFTKVTLLAQGSEEANRLEGWAE